MSKKSGQKRRLNTSVFEKINAAVKRVLNNIVFESIEQEISKRSQSEQLLLFPRREIGERPPPHPRRVVREQSPPPPEETSKSGTVGFADGVKAVGR